MIYSHFQNTTANRLAVTRVPKFKPSNTHGDTRFRGGIAEIEKPFPEEAVLDDLKRVCCRHTLV